MKLPSARAATVPVEEPEPSLQLMVAV